MMKKVYSIGFIVLLVSSLGAFASGSMKWKYSGAVSVGSKTIKTDIENAYTALETEEGLFLGGYKNARVGVNYPVIVFVSKSLEEQKIWPMEHSVSQFFSYDDELYALISDGHAYKSEKKDWELADLSFKPDSVIAWIEDDIVACNRSSMMKSKEREGSCYSLFNDWSIKANWQIVEPQVCDGKLVVFDRSASESQVHQINLREGTVVASMRVNDSPTDLCSIRF